MVSKEKVMPRIEKDFAGRVKVEYRDITDLNHYQSFLTLKDQSRSAVEFYLPMFYMDGTFINGKGDIYLNLKKLIIASSGLARSGHNDQPGDIDLVERFKKFSIVAIIGSGLTDGINPCAFTVIVFFMSFLALQGYRKGELVAIGAAFIFSVFLTYLLIGLGIFNFIYAVRGFWALMRGINIAVGALSVILGALCVYDIYKFKVSASPDNMLLQLPKPVKDKIHSVIGMHYRKGKDAQAPRHIFGLVLTALATGFLVSLLEAVCTGQLYVPTIAFILKTTDLKLQALGYLALYNLMFVIPLFVIFLAALFGATSSDFAAFMRKHIPTVKVFMALVFFGLGIFLIWRA
jgi:cytochrome c biogenesis protein CcdA